MVGNGARCTKIVRKGFVAFSRQSARGAAGCTKTVRLTFIGSRVPISGRQVTVFVTGKDRANEQSMSYVLARRLLVYGYGRLPVTPDGANNMATIKTVPQLVVGDVVRQHGARMIVCAVTHHGADTRGGAYTSTVCEVLERGDTIPGAYFDWGNGRAYWNVQGNEFARVTVE